MKLRAVSDLPPAEKRSPPECLIVPRALPLSSVPPVIGKLYAARAGATGATRTPAPLSAFATAGVELQRGGPARERVVRRLRGGCGGEQQRGGRGPHQGAFQGSSGG